MSLSANIISSKIAVSERWFKLYRRIHNLFLAKEFVHVDDYKTMFKGLNERIDKLNQKLDSNLNTISTTFASHIHNAPQAPGGVIPTAPPAAPMTPDLSPVLPVIYTNVKMMAEDNMWRGLGPAMAPLGSGTSLEATSASLTASQQITGEG